MIQFLYLNLSELVLAGDADVDLTKVYLHCDYARCAHLIQQAQEMRSLGVGIDAIRVQVLHREFTEGSLRVRRSSGSL